MFKGRVLNPVHLNQVSKYNDNKSNDKEGDSRFHEEDKEKMAVTTVKSTEKHRMKKIGYEHHHQAQQKRNPHKRGSEPQLSKGIVQSIRAPDSQASGSDDDVTSSRSIKPEVSAEEQLE